MMIFVIPVIAAIVLVIYYSAEQHANNKRIERGEKPVLHHDLTDNPPPMEVFEWPSRL